jgi:hypothetical protein
MSDLIVVLVDCTFACSLFRIIMVVLARGATLTVRRQSLVRGMKAMGKCFSTKTLRNSLVANSYLSSERGVPSFVHNSLLRDNGYLMPGQVLSINALPVHVKPSEAPS